MDTQGKYHQRYKKLRNRRTWMWNLDLCQQKKGYNRNGRQETYRNVRIGIIIGKWNKLGGGV